jgi:hypothetical protein
MLLKFSLWAAIFMSFSHIKGQLIPYHVVFLSLAAPLLIFHIASAIQHVRRDPMALATVSPFALIQVVRPVFFFSAVAVGLVVAVSLSLGISWQYPKKFFGDRDYYVEAPNATFEPSFLRAVPNIKYKSRFLGDSAGCGMVDCHPYAYADWVKSRHRFSVTNSYRQELETAAARCGKRAALRCIGCHDPISLLAGAGQDGRGLTTNDGRREGISCLVCHGLFADDRRPADTALVFHFPQYYFQQDLSSLSYFLALIQEHKDDFNAPGYPDDRLCIACHDIVPANDGDQPINAWLNRAYHRQEKMIPACRGKKGCLACHMPLMSDAEKPFSILHSHLFQNNESDRATSARPDHESSGGQP